MQPIIFLVINLICIAKRFIYEHFNFKLVRGASAVYFNQLSVAEAGQNTDTSMFILLRLIHNRLILHLQWVYIQH